MNNDKPGVYIKTFGCQMNEYDSEKMFRLLSDTYRPVETESEASLVIVNTCSVREKAEHKLFSLLGELTELKQSRPELIIGVGGCVAQQEGKQIVSRSPAVDFVVGTHNLSLIPSLAKNARAGTKRQIAVDYREEWEELPEEFDSFVTPTEDINRPGVTSAGISSSAILAGNVSPVRALVAIQRGCDKNCSYCVVPTTRGPEVSRAPQEILREIRAKVAMGAREVLLLGQTVNSYGKDLSPRYSFTRLVKEIAEIDKLLRIRFTSPHPAEVKPDFIELFATVPQLVSHIHLPLQSGSDRILKLMRRNYRLERYLEIVSALRERVPEIAITSDVIIGFPTETEAEFEMTLQVLEQVRFYSTFSFMYSPRPNTTSLTSFSAEQQLSETVKKQRLLRYQKRQEQIAMEILSSKVGTTLPVLVEGGNKHISSLIRGRTPENVLVEFEGEIENVGKLIDVQITGSSRGMLRGTMAGVTNSTENFISGENYG